MLKKNKTLIIVPGAGDPANESYLEEFKSLENLAKRNGYNNIITLVFPGHNSYSKSTSYHNVENSADLLIEELGVLERKEIKYDVFARSYGCGILLNVLIYNKLKFLERVILWAPPPLVYIFKLSVQEKTWIEKAKSKGAFFNNDTFNSSEEFSVMLLKYKGSQVLHIGFGEKDEHTKISYYNFLKDYLGNEKRLKFYLLEDQKHNLDYSQKIVNEFIFKK